jgi:hypothetical protein
VVVLEPRSSDCLIRCTIKEIDLSLGPAFEALSYTWAMDRDFGPPRIGEVRTFICNGQAFDAQRNLYNALIQLQRLRRSIPIWIDAICINQADTTEKTLQVNMMGDIYRASKLVIVWLGRTTVVAYFATRMAQGFFADDWITKQGHVARRADVSTPSAGKFVSLFNALMPISALAWILERSWFSRVWTAQETVLASKTMYLMGSRELPLDELVQSTTAIKQAWHSLEDGLAFSVRQMLDGARFIAEAREKNKCTLEEAMALSRLRQAKNPRDKVFAMLGFCNTHISADYQKSVHQVYCEFGATLLRSETSLYLLSLVGQVRQESRPQCDYEHAAQAWSKRLRGTNPIYNLPSWVPDLSFPTEPTPLRDTVDMAFAAGMSEDAKSAIDEANWTLQVSARAIGVITGAGNTLECAKHGQSSYLQPAWDYLHLPAGFGPIYEPTGEPTLTAFWKTLACGSESSVAEGRKSVRVNSQDFVEWFTLMSEEGGHIHPAEMRKHILGIIDRNHQTDPKVAKADIEQRRHRKYVFTSTLKLRDMQKAAAIRDFVDALDTPSHGLRQSMLQRHNNQAKLKSEPKDGGGGPEPLFEGVYQRNFADRRFFVIDKTYFGLAPWTARVGDAVMIVAGAYVPLIFRRSGADRWRLVGEAYCHGIMFGEEVPGSQPFETITIV